MTPETGTGQEHFFADAAVDRLLRMESDVLLERDEGVLVFGAHNTAAAEKKIGGKTK